ncbi:SMR family transporter [Marihabitans asiaticum]
MQRCDNRPMPYLVLAVAVLCEVAATTALKFSEGFTRLGPSLIVVAGYSAAFYLLSLSLDRGIPLGVAYGMWAAAGVALVAVIGVVLLGEGLTWVQVGGLGLVIAGVLALELGGQHPQ